MIDVLTLSKIYTVLFLSLTKRVILTFNTMHVALVLVGCL